MAKLGDIFTLVRNGANIKQEKGKSGIPITRIETISTKQVDRSKLGYADVFDIHQYENYILQDRDILMSHINSISHLGKSAIYHREEDEVIIHGMNLLCLRANADILCPQYAYYYFDSSNFRKQILAITKPSVNQASFTVAELKKIEIPLPDLDTQRRIAATLDKVTEGIAICKQMLSDLDALVKSRFVEMFGDENNPKGWPIVNVEEVADVQVGVVIKPAQYYTDSQNGVKAFRSLNVGPMYIKDTDWVYFSEEGNLKNQKSILKENDLLIVRSGAPGTACVVTSEYAGCNAVDIIIAHPNSAKVNPFYLAQYTNLPHGKRQIDEGTGGAAQQHFNVGKYNKLQLMLPPLDKQNEFEQFLKQLDKSKFLIQQQLTELDALKKSLMQGYFA